MKIIITIIIGVLIICTFILFMYSQELVITKDCDNIYNFEAGVYDTRNITDQLRAAEEVNRQELEMRDCLDTRHKTKLEVWLGK